MTPHPHSFQQKAVPDEPFTLPEQLFTGAILHLTASRTASCGNSGLLWSRCGWRGGLGRAGMLEVSGQLVRGRLQAGSGPRRGINVRANDADALHAVHAEGDHGVLEFPVDALADGAQFGRDVEAVHVAEERRGVVCCREGRRVVDDRVFRVLDDGEFLAGFVKLLALFIGHIHDPSQQCFEGGELSFDCSDFLRGGIELYETSGHRIPFGDVPAPGDAWIAPAKRLAGSKINGIPSQRNRHAPHQALKLR